MKRRRLVFVVLFLSFAVWAETAANSFVVTTAAGVRAADDGLWEGLTLVNMSQ